MIILITPDNSMEELDIIGIHKLDRLCKHKGKGRIEIVKN